MNASPFEVREEDGTFVVLSDNDEEFYMRADDEKDAYYACKLLNLGFRMGYNSGEFNAKLALRHALGLA
jgi:hypothetical protein